MTAVDDATSTDQTRLPFHLRGNYAPVMAEVEAFDLPVEGAIPPELNGRYMRNGANPKHGPTMHWFAGDGMLHGVRLRDGRAEWYRNRWVRTKALDGAERLDPSTGTFDLTVGLANTHVVRHAGRILALEEASFPNEISPELDTLGPYDFDGALHTPCTAHPHVCPETGEMHFFGYELVQRAVRHLPRRRCQRPADPQPADRRGRAHDGARLRDQPELRDLHGPAGRVRSRTGDDGHDAVPVERGVRRTHRSAAS